MTFLISSRVDCRVETKSAEGTKELADDDTRRGALGVSHSGCHAVVFKELPWADVNRRRRGSRDAKVGREEAMMPVLLRRGQRRERDINEEVMSFTTTCRLRYIEQTEPRASCTKIIRDGVGTAALSIDGITSKSFLLIELKRARKSRRRPTQSLVSVDLVQRRELVVKFHSYDCGKLW